MLETSRTTSRTNEENVDTDGISERVSEGSQTGSPLSAAEIDRETSPSGGRYHINVPYRHYFYFDGNYYFINVPYRHDFYVDSHYYFEYISCWVVCVFCIYSAFTWLKIVTFDFCLGVGKRVQRPQNDGDGEEEKEVDVIFNVPKKKKEKKTNNGGREEVKHPRSLRSDSVC